MQELVIPKKPCLYTRLSYAPDGVLEKVERQESDGRATGARLRWPDFCCVYVDNGVSAWQRNRKRPDWDRMLLTLDRDSGRLVPSDPKANHQHDGIMVYHGDRLIRQPFDLELLLNLADQRHIPLASVSGVRDLASADDRFILRIEAAQACRESDNISRRVRRGVESMMTGKNGTTKARSRPGGRRPFGWGVPTGATRVKVDPVTGEERVVDVLDMDKKVSEEADLLAAVATKMLAGLSKRGGVRWMNQRSRTSRGNVWCETTLTRAVTAWRMAGLVEYRGSVYEAAWDEVIPLETLLDLRALFAEKAQDHGYYGQARRYLLSGHGVCSTCHDLTKSPKAAPRCTTSVRLCREQHARLTTKPINGTRLYCCPLCGKGRNVAYFDAYVEGRTLRLLSDPRLAQELQAGDDQAQRGVREEIAELQRKSGNLRKQIANAADLLDFDPMLAMQAVASYERRQAKLSAQLAAERSVQQIEAMIGISPEAWAAEPVEIRASVLATLWQVVMMPARQGRGFDPDSVRLWRRSLVKNM